MRIFPMKQSWLSLGRYSAEIAPPPHRKASASAKQESEAWFRKVSAQPNLLSVYLNSKLRTSSPVEFHRTIQNVSNSESDIFQ